MRLLSALPLAMGTAALGLAGLRFVVVLLETFEVVRGERGSDEELLLLCGEGVARTSPRMQITCMEASAAQASPILITAVVRASLAFIDEMWGLVASPLHSFSIAGVFGALGVLPWLSTLRTLFGGAVAATAPRDSGRHHVVVLQNGSMKQHLTEGMLTMRGGHSRISAQPMLEECDDQTRLGWRDVSLGARHAKQA